MIEIEYFQFTQLCLSECSGSVKVGISSCLTFLTLPEVHIQCASVLHQNNEIDSIWRRQGELVEMFRPVPLPKDLFPWNCLPLGKSRERRQTVYRGECFWKLFFFVSALLQSLEGKLTFFPRTMSRWLRLESYAVRVYCWRSVYVAS